MKLQVTLFALVFFLTIISCADDPCDSINCGPYAVCNNATGECNCLPGFSGPNCEIQDLCYAKDCTQRGTCNEDTGICDCESGYEGHNCEFTVKDKYLGLWTSFDWSCSDTIGLDTISIKIVDGADLFNGKILGIHSDTLDFEISQSNSRAFNIPDQTISIASEMLIQSGNGTQLKDTLRIEISTEGVNTVTCSGLFLRGGNNIIDNTSVIDTAGLSVTYTDNIAPIISSSCGIDNLACHSSNSTSTFPMSNYDETVTSVGFGRTLGAINHELGYSPMPKLAPKLDQTQIDLITEWIVTGTPE